jgi:hypothetical protein
MGYKISSSYRWYIIPKEPPVLTKVYFIEGLPFEIDPIDEPEASDLKILSEADSNPGIHANEAFIRSEYLISEMMHPFLFELDIENPEEMPTDYVN